MSRVKDSVLVLAALYLLLVPIAADYHLELTLLNYSNPTHRRSNGELCDGSTTNPCDNIFTFEMDVGKGWGQEQKTGRYQDNDSITFERVLLGGLNNPLVFSGGKPRQDVKLRTVVYDFDPGSQPLQLVFEAVTIIKPNREPTQYTISNTSTRRVISTRTLYLESRIVCGENYYGPDCSVHCSPSTDGFYTCITTYKEKNKALESVEIIGSVLLLVLVTLLIVIVVSLLRRRFNRNQGSTRPNWCTCNAKAPYPPKVASTRRLIYTPEASTTCTAGETAFTVVEPTALPDGKPLQSGYTLCEPNEDMPVRGNDIARRQVCDYRYVDVPQAVRGEVPFTKTHGRYTPLDDRMQFP